MNCLKKNTLLKKSKNEINEINDRKQLHILMMRTLRLNELDGEIVTDPHRRNIHFEFMYAIKQSPEKQAF